MRLPINHDELRQLAERAGDMPVGEAVCVLAARIALVTQQAVVPTAVTPTTVAVVVDVPEMGTEAPATTDEVEAAPAATPVADDEEIVL